MQHHLTWCSPSLRPPYVCSFVRELRVTFEHRVPRRGPLCCWGPFCRGEVAVHAVHAVRAEQRPAAPHIVVELCLSVTPMRVRACATACIAPCTGSSVVCEAFGPLLVRFRRGAFHAVLLFDFRINARGLPCFAFPSSGSDTR